MTENKDNRQLDSTTANNMYLSKILEELKKLNEIPKLLFVEDGSVDVKVLEETFAKVNTNILLVPVRQGAKWPTLMSLTDSGLLPNK